MPTERPGGPATRIAAHRVALGCVPIALALSALGCDEAPAARTPSHDRAPEPVRAAPAEAEAPRWRDVSRDVEAVRAAHGAVALGAAVVDREGAIAIGVAGRRRVEGEEPVALDDRWHLGSDTKAMTATLAAILVEDGAIGWDTTVSEVFDGFADRIHPALRGVTLTHLLNHRAGLTADLRVDFPLVWLRLLADLEPVRAQRRWLAEQLLTTPPVVAVGSEQRYSNAGYVVAGAMLEQRTGRSFEHLLRSRLFEPLEMTSCGFGPPGSEETVDEPRGHRSGPLRSAFSDNPAALGPAGTVHCSLEDWARFAALHLRGFHEDTELLPRTAFAHLRRAPFDGEYANGFSIVERRWSDGPVYRHSGSNTMWYAVIWLAPSTGRAYLAATNVGPPTGAEVTEGIITALFQRFPPPERDDGATAADP